MSWTGNLAQKMTDYSVEREKKAKEISSDKEKLSKYMSEVSSKEKIWTRIGAVFLILVGISAVYLHLAVITEAEDVFVFMLLAAPMGYLVIAAGSLLFYYATGMSMYLAKTSFKLGLISTLLSLIVLIGDIFARGHWVYNILITFVLLIATIVFIFRK